jgi:hypothetical protein
MGDEPGSRIRKSVLKVVCGPTLRTTPFIVNGACRRPRRRRWWGCAGAITSFGTNDRLSSADDRGPSCVD